MDPQIPGTHPTQKEKGEGGNAFSPFMREREPLPEKEKRLFLDQVRGLGKSPRREGGKTEGGDIGRFLGKTAFEKLAIHVRW